MSIALSLTLFLLMCALGIYSGLYFTRYTAAVANDMGSELSKERTGRVDDAGMTSYERGLFWGVVMGSYRTHSPDTVRLGRISRVLLALTAAAMVLFIAWLNYVGVGR